MNKKNDVVQNEQILSENFYNDIQSAQMRGFYMLFDSDEDDIEENPLTNEKNGDILKP